MQESIKLCMTKVCVSYYSDVHFSKCGYICPLKYLEWHVCASPKSNRLVPSWAHFSRCVRWHHHVFNRCMYAGEFVSIPKLMVWYHSGNDFHKCAGNCWWTKLCASVCVLIKNKRFVRECCIFWHVYGLWMQNETYKYVLWMPRSCESVVFFKTFVSMK